MNVLSRLVLLVLIGSTAFAADEPMNATQAAERVVIPKVAFREASLLEVVDYVAVVSRREKSPQTYLNVVVADSPAPQEKISLQRENVSLLAVLKEAAAQAGCEVQDEAHALVVRRKGAPPLPAIVNAAGVNGETIRRKLDQIVLPRVNFRESTVREAIEFLVQKTKQLDPDGGGVSVVLKMEDLGPPPANQAVDVRGIPGLPADAPVPNAAARALTPPKIPRLAGLPAGAPPAPALQNREIRISLQVANMPILELLRYIAGIADLQVTIDKFAVVITHPGKK